jgi:WXXGXW repeat (2 copies)
MNIIKKTALLIAALAFMSGILAPAANAISLSINVGDQPYYAHGPGYWNGGVYYVWVPGHWRWHHGQKYWVHGHYRVR